MDESLPHDRTHRFCAELWPCRQRRGANGVTLTQTGREVFAGAIHQGIAQTRGQDILRDDETRREHDDAYGEDEYDQGSVDASATQRSGRRNREVRRRHLFEDQDSFRGLRRPQGRGAVVLIRT